MNRDLEKDLMEIDTAIKQQEKRDNTFTASVLQRAKQLIMDRQWIPCSERLPDDDRSVLIQCSGRFGNIVFEDAIQMASWYSDSGWCVDEYYDWLDPEVAAWCELPEPYVKK